MSFSKEEQILRELRWMNTQLNPAPAAFKAFGFLILLGVVFMAVALLVNSADRPKRAQRGSSTRALRLIPSHVVKKGEPI